MPVANLPKLVPFLMAGDGGVDRTLAVLLELDHCKPNRPAYVELGIPFSDPVADGPILQAAAKRALKAGTTTADVFQVASRYRDAGGTIPLLAFSYCNPLFQVSLEQTVQDLADAGFAGALVPDLPLEEWRPFAAAMSQRNLAAIPFAAPTTCPERLAESVQLGGGFLYAIGRLGTTGQATSMDGALLQRLAQLRSDSRLPVGVGFGISSAVHIQALRGHVDLAVVGSALVEAIHRGATESGASSPLTTHTKAARIARQFLEALQA
jgi:tryptophan synthase alpha chain